MKTCRTCGVSKAEWDFKARYVTCKECQRPKEELYRKANSARATARATAWQKENRDRHAVSVTKYANANPGFRHGISTERYQAMLLSQGGCCANAGCRSQVPGGRGRWNIDHDHRCCPGTFSCGKCVRGLLCGRCNLGIGMFYDNPDSLTGAADYLRPRTFEAGVSGGLV